MVLPQRLRDCLENSCKGLALILKLDLVFLRMDVDIHALRVQLKVEHEDWVCSTL